jgi:hypothetical protein
MTLSLTCPECQSKLKGPDNLAAKKIKCPKCSALFRVPAHAKPTVTAEAPPPQPQSVPPSVDPDVETLEEDTIKPVRVERDIRRNRSEDTVSTFIPYKNVRALIAYYLGIFSLIPCAGLLLGPASLILGILGLRYVKVNPTAKGTGHAIAGVILGGLTMLANWGVVIAVMVTGGVAAFQSKILALPTTPSQPAFVPRIPPGGGRPPARQVRPLFAGDQDLVNPDRALNLPPEPGRRAAVRVADFFNAIALSPDGKTLAVSGSIATNGTVHLWDMDGKPPSTPRIVAHAQCLAFSPDGKHLAMPVYDKSMNNEFSWFIAIYSRTTKRVEQKLSFDSGPGPFPQMEMAYPPDGTLLAATSHSTFRIWDVATGKERPHKFTAPTWHIRSLAFAPDGKTLAVGAGDRVLLWDVDAMREKGVLKQGVLTQPDSITSVAFSSDGKTVASSSNDTIKLWDAGQGKELHTLKGHAGVIRCVRFSPNGKLLAASDVTSALWLWDVSTGKMLASRKGGNQGIPVSVLVFAPDGKTLLSTNANEGIIKAWDVVALMGQKQ